jgi:hypothetical protein
MPALKNHKHEWFAQELAKGKSQGEAYAETGYAPSDQHASRLASNGKIQARIAEIQARSAIRHEVTLASLMQEAGEIQAAAITANQLSAASQALTIKAKLAGLWIERKEVGRPGEFESMNADELRDYIARENAELGISTTPAALVNGSGKPH